MIKDEIYPEITSQDLDEETSMPETEPEAEEGAPSTEGEESTEEELGTEGENEEI